MRKTTGATRLGLGWMPLVAALACAAAAPVGAQQVWRQVGPDGRVTFTDMPPDPRSAQPVLQGPGMSADGNPTLPFTLREVVNRYPVVMYTGTGCGPCDAGRQLLSQRGVPYQERTVTTSADLAILQRMAGDAQVPVLMIGRQQLKGYSADEWNQYLDAAGYPRTSALPAGYRQPSPTALAPRTAPAAPIPPAGAANAMPGAVGAGSVPDAPQAVLPYPAPLPPRSVPTPSPQAGPGNPAGITF